MSEPLREGPIANPASRIYTCRVAINWMCATVHVTMVKPILVGDVYHVVLVGLFYALYYTVHSEDVVSQCGRFGRCYYILAAL